MADLIRTQGHSSPPEPRRWIVWLQKTRYPRTLDFAGPFETHERALEYQKARQDPSLHAWVAVWGL